MIINKLDMFNFRQYIGPQSVEFSTDKDKNVTVLLFGKLNDAFSVTLNVAILC